MLNTELIINLIGFPVSVPSSRFINDLALTPAVIGLKASSIIA